MLLGVLSLCSGVGYLESLWSINIFLPNLESELSFFNPFCLDLFLLFEFEG